MKQDEAMSFTDPGDRDEPAVPSGGGSRPGRRSSGLAAVFGVGGLIVGAAAGAAAAVLLGWGGTDFATDEPSARAELQIDYACGLTEKIEGRTEFEAIGSDPALWEASAIGYLMMAAAINDPQYEAFTDAGNEAVGAVNRLALDDLLSDAARLCADR